MNNELLTLFASYMEKQEILSKLTESEKLHGYNYSEIHTIDAIGKIESPNVTGISEYMHMTRGAISKIAKKLQQDGMIDTYRLPDNQQKKRHELWLQRDNDFLEKYSDKYLEQLKEFMTDFNCYLEEQIERLGEEVNDD